MVEALLNAPFLRLISGLLRFGLLMLAVPQFATYAQIDADVGGAMVATEATDAAVSNDIQLRPLTFSHLAKRLSPAVVNISITQSLSTGETIPQSPPGSPLAPFNEFFGRDDDGMRRMSSLGSGFVIDADGIIVTNNHVIENADEVTVSFPDGLTLQAQILGRDEETDLAVLRVEHYDPLPFVKWGDSDLAEVGDWVLAIGNPFGLGGSVTSGVVSARNRDINAGRYDAFIQTDASINKGNSGGPLFNLAGDVIGVNTAIISPSGGSVGIGFSSPSNLAKRVVAQLLEHGEMKRSYLGVSIQEVSPNLAESYGLKKTAGALIIRVDIEGPAAKASIMVGDLLTAFNDKPISDTRDLVRYVSEAAAEKTHKITLIRERDEITLDIILEYPESDRGEADASIELVTAATEEIGNFLGLELLELDDTHRRRHSVPDSIVGVMIGKIDSRSDASGKVMPGDVIVEVEFEDVISAEEALEKAKKARAEERPVLLRIYRDGVTVFRSIRPR